MHMVLFVGDVLESLAEQARKYDSSAKLVSGKIDLSTARGVYYTSIGDTDVDTFFGLCLAADKIYYCVPKEWSDQKNDGKSELQSFTERVIFWVGQTRDVVIIGNGQPRYQYFSSVGNNEIIKTTSHEKCLWSIGCSITQGVGVETFQTWKELVSKELKLPLIDVSCSGSSLLWASDKICRANIKKGDVVFWGMTGHHRLNIWYNQQNQEAHLVPRGLVMSDSQSMQFVSKTQLTSENQLEKFHADVLDNDTLRYHNLLAVKRAFHHCRSIGAEIVGVGMIDDPDCLYRFYDEKPFYQMISWPQSQYVDFGTDRAHPGPMQHQRFADKFIELWKGYYQ